MSDKSKTIYELKKDILQNLSLNNLEGVKEGLAFGLFIGAKDLLNELLFSKINNSDKPLNIDDQIKLTSLGADSDLLVNEKIKDSAFYDLLKLSKELPEGIDWKEKSQLFYNNFGGLNSGKEKNFYQQRLEFFIPQFLELHKDKKNNDSDPLSLYEKIILEINQNKDPSIYHRLNKIISFIPNNEKINILDKVVDYALTHKNNALYALYDFCKIGQNSTNTNKFASFFIEKKNGFFLNELFDKTHFNINDFVIHSHGGIPSNSYQKK